MEIRHRALSAEEATEPPPSPPPSKDQQHLTRLPALAMDRRFLFLFVIILFCVLFFAVSRVSSSDRARPSLVKAFVTFRHGSRAPGFTYNNDPYSKDDETFWPDGPGELTKMGKYEAYELGKKLRARYKEFVGDHYKPKDFRAYSTLVERTLMSAQLVLAAFFPPQGYQDWNSEMNWQPVPVYPETIINGTVGTNCPRFLTEFKHHLKHIIPSDLGLDGKEEKLLQEHTGEVNALPYTLFARVFDSVYFQDRANLPIPDWVKPLYPEKMTAAALKFLKYYLAGSHNQRLLVLGPYGRGLNSYFTESPRKMEFHSWHDLNVLSLLFLLGVDVKMNMYPAPTCALAIELHEKDGEQFFEVYYYPNSEAKHPMQMELPCGLSCPFSEFLNITSTYDMDDYMEFCNSAEIMAVPLTEFKLHF